jgi:hypothetical protein
MITASVPAEVLDTAHTDGALAAVDLVRDRYTIVDLEPGDATVYRIALIWEPERRDSLAIALLNFSGATQLPTHAADGTPCRWDAGYLVSKFGLADTNDWTAQVVASFIDGVTMSLPVPVS